MYAYALNNPYKFVDPNGEAALLATAAGGAGIGFVIGAAKEAWHAHGSGSDFGSINTWRNIGAKGAGGAVFGFGIGLTGGLGLVPATLVSGTASLAGGALERSLDADEATQPGDLTEIVSDAAGGMVGGGVGFGAQALLRARINYPEYFRVLQRQISRAKRVAGNTLRPSRHAARLEQVRRLQSDHELMTVWWGRITVQWPAAVARSGSKTATKAVVTVTISFLTEDEEGSR
ncbi:MAG: hypothetical protein KJZ84_17060 [Bryobacteraceae bacterium]|nr:hypothetical protein [Bryobacteraceae bacterium]